MWLIKHKQDVHGPDRLPEKHFLPIKKLEQNYDYAIR